MSNLDTRVILAACLSARACCNLSRRAGMARRDIQSRVPLEEVSRTQEQSHGLGGHNGEVFWRGEVGDAKGVPQDDIFVVDLLVGICVNPLR